MSNVHHYGTVLALRPDEPIDQQNVQHLDELVASNVGSGVPNVVMDLSETPLIDGAGLEWLLEVDSRCSKWGGCVRLCSANELCRDILRITRVGKLIEQFDDLPLALGSFG